MKSDETEQFERNYKSDVFLVYIKKPWAISRKYFSGSFCQNFKYFRLNLTQNIFAAKYYEHFAFKFHSIGSNFFQY